MQKETKQGRTYVHGQACSPDLRQLIVDECVLKGGDLQTKTIPRGTYTAVAERFRVTLPLVRKLWMQCCLTGNYTKKEHGGGHIKKLGESEVRYMEALTVVATKARTQTLMKCIDNI
jgi:hypothetical protein